MAESPEDFYLAYQRLLLGIAVDKFGVPPEDAEDILHDVFLAFLRCKAPARDPRRWLIGAMCHASRYYWRRAARVAPLEEASEPVAAALEAPVIARELLARLRPRDGRVLRRRYIEGWSFREIAEAERITEKRAERVVKQALRRAAATPRRRRSASAAPSRDPENSRRS
jgi:RNA polymerase sigma factor (sigma-70 family)